VVKDEDRSGATPVAEFARIQFAAAPKSGESGYFAILQRIT
jgi:hypothetical protein